jgi:hypothetical protein
LRNVQPANHNRIECSSLCEQTNYGNTLHNDKTKWPPEFSPDLLPEIEALHLITQNFSSKRMVFSSTKWLILKVICKSAPTETLNRKLHGFSRLFRPLTMPPLSQIWLNLKKFSHAKLI